MKKIKYINQIKRFFKTDFGIALIIALAYQITMTVIGVIINFSTDNQFTLLSHTFHWDAGWYITILKGGYITNGAAPAFYPLFPVAVILVRLATFNSISFLMAGQLINIISLWFAIAALLKIGRIFFKDNRRYYLVALLLSAPAAYFLHTFYSEALFIAIGFWSYLFALKKKWLAVGLLLALLTAARLPGLLFVGLALLEFARQYDWNLKKIINPKLTYFLLAPIGFLSYALYLQIVRGDFLAMFHAYHATQDWTYQVFDLNFINTISMALYKAVLILSGIVRLNKENLINIIIPVILLMIIGITSFYLIKQKDNKYKPLGIMGLASIIMFTLNSNVVSIHRYALPILGIYVAAVLYLKQQKLLILFCVLGIVAQLGLYYLFISDVFSG